jgi:NitT/TauT family transport system ATP-binding protein
VISVKLSGIGMVYGGKIKNEVLRDINLSIAPGESVVIRGANGVGKTTLLNIVAGILRPTHGTVEYGIPPAEYAQCAFVPQDYTSSLLPWFNVVDNIAIPLRLRGVKKLVRVERTLALLDELGFSLPATAFPHQLSGGQRQRVAIARALIANPSVLLLDEPFANLDTRTVRELEEALLKVQEVRGVSFLLVSHDIDSSILLAHRIALLSGYPAEIGAFFPVPIPRPRQRNMMFSVEFARVRASVLIAEENELKVAESPRPAGVVDL